MGDIRIGIIGGSGLYDMEELRERSSIEIETPFGAPSAPVVTGTISGKRVAFLARHGNGHVLTPSEVNYRANIHALKQLGVRYILAVSACGSLKEAMAPGHAVVPDQLFDFTRGNRRKSFFEAGVVAHVGVADPFCSYARSVLIDAASKRDGSTVHDHGTFITIEGPRFSTRAESALFRTWNMDIIGMTTSPEAFLAREAQIGYAVLAHVTDYDVWHEVPVSSDMVMKTFARNIAHTRETIAHAVSMLDESHESEAHHALDGALTTAPGAISQEQIRRYEVLFGRPIR